MPLRYVKNTMRNALANLLSPHYCCSCGGTGAILCEYCKYDIISEPYQKCIACNAVTPYGTNLCLACIMPYSRAWCVGERKDALENLLKSYKFERAKLAYLVIAELLDAVVPVLPDTTIVVSVPTIRTHIRRRGYDHAALVAKAFAAKRKLVYKPILERLNDSVQLGATKAVRHKQASVAYRASENNEPNILLIDDVFTTGATAHYAAKALREAGTENVFLAVLARQPLEKEAKN